MSYVSNATFPGLVVRLRANDAVGDGSNNVTAWVDASGNGRSAITFAGVKKELAIFPDGSAAVNVGDNGLNFNNPSTPFRVAFILLKGSPLTKNVTNYGPIIGRSVIDGQRVFAGDSNKITGVVKLINANTDTVVDTWINGVKVPYNALTVDPGKATVIAIRIPVGKAFDTIASDFGFSKGGKYLLGDLVGVDATYTDAEVVAKSQEIMAAAQVAAELPNLLYGEDDSIGHGWWALENNRRFQGRFNANALLNGTALEWYCCHQGSPGEQVTTNGPGVVSNTARRASLAAAFASPLWNHKVYCGSKHTNDIAANKTVASIIDAIVAEIDYAWSVGATHCFYRTPIARRQFGVGFIGGYAGFEAKRLEIRDFLLANVYPVGHAKAGQQLLTGVIDSGGPTINYSTVLPVGGTILPGSPNYMGIVDGPDQAAGWSWYGSFWGERGIGISIAGSQNANRNDGIHPSDIGGKVIEEETYQQVIIGTTAPPTIPTTAPTITLTQIVGGYSIVTSAAPFASSVRVSKNGVLLGTSSSINDAAVVLGGAQPTYTAYFTNSAGDGPTATETPFTADSGGAGPSRQARRGRG